MKKLALLASSVAVLAAMAVYVSTASADTVVSTVCTAAPTVCSTAGVTPWDGWDTGGGVNQPTGHHCDNVGSPVAYLPFLLTTGSRPGTSWYTVDPGGAGDSCNNPVLAATGYVNGPVSNPSCGSRNPCDGTSAGYVQVLPASGGPSAGGKGTLP